MAKKIPLSFEKKCHWRSWNTGTWEIRPVLVKAKSLLSRFLMLGARMSAARDEIADREGNMGIRQKREEFERKREQRG